MLLCVAFWIFQNQKALVHAIEQLYALSMAKAHLFQQARHVVEAGVDERECGEVVDYRGDVQKNLKSTQWLHVGHVDAEEQLHDQCDHEQVDALDLAAISEESHRKVLKCACVERLTSIVTIWKEECCNLDDDFGVDEVVANFSPFEAEDAHEGLHDYEGGKQEARYSLR